MKQSFEADLPPPPVMPANVLCQCYALGDHAAVELAPLIVPSDTLDAKGAKGDASVFEQHAPESLGSFIKPSQKPAPTKPLLQEPDVNA